MMGDDNDGNRVSAPWVALLGKPGTPIDGVEDYCTYLGVALSCHSLELQLIRVRWAGDGWLLALRDLWREASHWRESWVLFQFTAMAWSRSGFPLGALVAITVLRWRGVRCAVVFHEPFGLGGPRLIDRIREACQNWVIRQMYRLANKAVFVEPLDKICWLRHDASKVAFIPIGANLPKYSQPLSRTAMRNHELPTVGVFCLSDPPTVREELVDISRAAKAALESGAAFRFVFLGRGTAEVSTNAHNALGHLGIDTKYLGLLPPDRVAEVLSGCDAMLCVRGRLYMRRGSAIAGLASGLAIVGYEGAAEGTPLTDSGVVLVPYRDGVALGKALARILADRRTLSQLKERSRNAYATHFTWGSIASRLIHLLNDSEA
jgi:glycosyltransferase involved in cell wall biosynthesis